MCGKRVSKNVQDLFTICDKFPFSQCVKEVQEVINNTDDFDLICHRLYVLGYLHGVKEKTLK